MALVGWWKLDEGSGATALDSSGNDLTGTITDATWTSGKIGNALAFNGTTAYVEMGNQALLNFGTGDFSLAAWFYLNSLPGEYKSIINKGSSGHSGYGLEVNDSNLLSASIMAVAGTNQHVAFGAPSPGVWHHVVASFPRSDQVYIYLNGVLAGNAAYAAGNTGSVDTTDTFNIGRYFDNVWFFNGMIDDVRVYSHALTGAEATALFDLGNRGERVDTYEFMPKFKLRQADAYSSSDHRQAAGGNRCRRYCRCSCVVSGSKRYDGDAWKAEHCYHNGSHYRYRGGSRVEYFPQRQDHTRKE